MAASYAYNHTDQIDGLVLWASYPASSNNLSNSILRLPRSLQAWMDFPHPDKIEASRTSTTR